MVNHYGQLAMDHWRVHRPNDLRALTDPQLYFEDLGDQVQSAITSLRDELLAKTPTSMANVRERTAQALTQAEEIVLTELVWRGEEPTAGALDPILERYYRALQEANTSVTTEPSG